MKDRSGSMVQATIKLIIGYTVTASEVLDSHITIVVSFLLGSSST